ncbi:hypothetical protein ACBJ59_12115 [Nonomuraea sp. MTCD27]|uniref:hypothetical protein n=1 Tax=Nonomuraea sp. MTCD27 TaxID=1676747 RepID=UPI0035BFA264
MSRYGRAYPAPQRRVGPNYRGVNQDAPLGVFTTSWSFPALTVTSPSVTIPLGVFTVSWEWPAATPSVGLGVFTTSWEWPTLTPVIPINPGDDLTGPGQLSFGGFKLGSGTPYRFIQLEGADLDLPPVDNGNVPHPSAHGALSGRSLAQARVITYTMLVRAPREEIQQVAEALRDNTPLPDSDDETDLALQVLDTIYVTRGKVLRRSIPIDRLYRLGHTRAVVQWECSDPRLYAQQLSSVEVPDGGSVDVAHDGNTNTRPVIRLRGPAETPTITVQRTLADGRIDTRVLQFGLNVADGAALIVDVGFGTATIDGVSQMRSLTGASVGVPDWVLGRGTSTIAYATDVGDAPNAVVLWRHAWL